MSNEYFRDQIFHGTEERSLEYKSSISWGSIDTKEKIVVACLAMANTPDGGTIVIGVDEDKEKGQFTACGMLQEHVNSFKQDDVSDFINKYADPYIELKINRVDIDDKTFIVIQVQEYQETPIICKQSGQKIKCGDIYIRSKRKNASSRVASQNEMREILNRAISKSISSRIQMYNEISSVINEKNDHAEHQYNAQIEASFQSESDDLIKEVKNSPNWEVIIRPSDFENDRVEKLVDLQKMISACRVSLRGWDFPHADHNEIKNGNGYIFSGNNWFDTIEYWRLFKSLQFVYISNIRENSPENIKNASGASWGDFDNSKATGYLSIVNTVFRITEIFEFARRLIENEFITSSIEIVIKLNGVKNFKLFYWEKTRLLNGPYLCATNSIEVKSKMRSDEFLTKAYDEAIGKVIEIFEYFNWNDPPRKMLSEDQRKLLENRV